MPNDFFAVDDEVVADREEGKEEEEEEEEEVDDLFMDDDEAGEEEHAKMHSQLDERMAQLNEAKQRKRLRRLTKNRNNDNLTSLSHSSDEEHIPGHEKSKKKATKPNKRGRLTQGANEDDGDEPEEENIPPGKKVNSRKLRVGDPELPITW